MSIVPLFQLHSDVDSGIGNIKYILSGEGAGTIFVIDDKTGNIHATKTLDREEQAQYTLTAQAVDRDTNKPLEPPSEFIVKVQDINDNPPEFLHGPYHATVPEMSNVGTSVMQVTASDADDPTYGNSAKLVYSILEGQPYFSVEPQTVFKKNHNSVSHRNLYFNCFQTVYLFFHIFIFINNGIIRTALPNMDREARQEYNVVIQAKDMGGHMGGLSGTTKVTITLTDVNDNPPKFPQSRFYSYSVLKSPSSISFIPSSLFECRAEALLPRVLLKPLAQSAFMVGGEKSHRAICDPVLPRLKAGVHNPWCQVNCDWLQLYRCVYAMSVSEDAVPGEEVGRLKAKDPDLGENGLVSYRLLDGDGVNVFEISTDSQTREGIIKLKKPVDFETKRAYTLKVEASNVHLDPRYISWGPYKDTATVKIMVEDADEPPVFTLPSYSLEVEENSPSGTVVGRVHAKDTDVANSPIKYKIDRHSDLDRYFSINYEDGIIKTTVPLDREQMPWHNISVIALETLGHQEEAKVHVYIKVRDVNDNGPEFATMYETVVCENAPLGKLIQTISAVDKDEMTNRQRFSFSIAQEAVNNQNFTLKDNRDSTAHIYVSRKGFSRQTQELYLLPIEINDNGNPPRSSTNTLTIRVCGCDNDGTVQSCNVEPYILPAGLSTGALIAILACIVILLVIVVLFVALRRQKKEPLIVFEEEDVRENIITYDDEGGGEEDTEAFDIATLQNPDGANGFLPRKDIKPELQFPPRPGVRPVPNSVDVDDFIKTRISDADNDPTAPPYDSIQIYGYEGRGSIAGSLSSLESATTDSDLDYDYLQSWGPRFKKLADLYGTKDTDNDDS
ncbi:CAD11 protein, partial [Amia calva]|nr:CAD11 protein [Amia calva]